MDKAVFGSEPESRRFVVCVTGSVAIFEGLRLVRELSKKHDVTVVMSETAAEWISPLMFEWASKEIPIVDLTGEAEHISVFEEVVDCVVVYPATVNTICKMANGICDTSVTLFLAVALGLKLPIIIAPAAHLSLYENPIVQECVEKLKSLGVRFTGPRLEEGKAKVALVEDVIEILETAEEKDFVKKRLSGTSFLITAGPTREYIDDIRFLTNKSSGKMGVALSKEALNLGADVTLVIGKGSTVSPPPGAKSIWVETTQEMTDAALSEIDRKKQDVIIGVAAISDFTFEKFEGKIPSEEEISVKLKPLPKLVEIIREKYPSAYIVGFKAEYNVSDEELIKRAKNKLKESKLDMVVANDVAREGAGFGTDTNEVIIVDEETIKKLSKLPKTEIAKIIIDLLAEKIGFTQKEN
ncbi:MAG: bifunctional phosphopantothenoylcysteine decarboxylase/phosphopantothenate--cysteine ligase CoaBC [Asgard group archaeon]